MLRNSLVQMGYTRKMERPYGRSRVSFHPLPSICEYREFGSEEECQAYVRTGSCSKLFKTRNAYSTQTQRRVGDDEGTEEERPLLSLYPLFDSNVCDDGWAPFLPPKKQTQRRVGDDNDTEEERPLLRLYPRFDSKVCDDGWTLFLPPMGRKKQRRVVNKVHGKKWKSRVAKGFQMQRRKVTTAWARSLRYRQSLRSALKSSAKVLTKTPILLVKTMRDAYVRVMNRFERECDRRMWFLPAARMI